MGKVTHPGVGFDGEADAREGGSGGLTLVPPVDVPSHLRREGADAKILQNRQRRHETKVLVDESEAEPPRRAGLDGQRDGIAVNGERCPRLRLVETGQHFDQRRLAGTVLPEKAVHLPGQNCELDLIERQRSAKTFRQPPDRQRRASARRRRGARSGHHTPQRAL